MKKTAYTKPAMQVVALRQQRQLLQVVSPKTNLSPEEELDIDETPQSGWGR